MSPDARLLAAVARGDGAALGELVRRYVDFVFAAAARRLSDRHAAEDVTQCVFLVLAKKAGAIRAGALPAWLHRTTQHLAANANRAARRRARHERAAARPEAIMPEPPPDPDPLLSLLDAAIDTLAARDRRAVIERYLLGRDYAAVGAAVGLSAASAQKRVERAVDKLRRHFARAGVPTGSAAVAAVLTAAAPSPATAALPAVAARIVQSISAAGTAPASALTAKGVLAVMTGTKLKLAAAGLAALLLFGAAGVMLFRDTPAPMPPASPPPAPSMAASPPAAVTPPASRPAGLAATLADGTIAEVALIGDGESDDWWTPDGRPAPPPTIERMGPRDRVRPAPPGKRWVRVMWCIERPGAAQIHVVAHPIPPSNTGSSSAFSFDGGRPWNVERIAVDAGQTTLTWRVTTASKSSIDVSLDRPADGNWTPDTAAAHDVPGLGRVVIRNPREVELSKRSNGRGAAFDYVLPASGGSWGRGINFADAAGRTDWNTPSPMPPDVGDAHTWAAFVPLKDVARVTLTLTHWDEWVEFVDLPMRPVGPAVGASGAGASMAPRVVPHEPPAAVPAGAKLAPFTDLRFAGDVPQVLVNDVWWEWITFDRRPVTVLIADAKRLDERQWQKRLGEDLVDVLAAGGFTAGPTASVGLKSLDGTSTSTTDLPMTADNRRLVRERRAMREAAGDGRGL